MSGSIILAGTTLLAGSAAFCRDRIPACQSIACLPKSIVPPDEIVDFAARLVRIPTVNPPGEEYEACANVIGDQLRAHGADVQLLPAIGRHEHTPQHPRINVVGRHAGRRRAGDPPQRPLRRRARRSRLDARSVRRRDRRRPLVWPRLLRHEGRHRRGGVCRRGDPARRRRARRADRSQRHGRRGERRLCRRRVAGGESPACRASGPRP